MFTAQQNIVQRGHDEQRDGLSNKSDVTGGNFLALIHLRCKDMINLIASLCSTRSGHLPAQNELLQIIADLIDQRITMCEPADGMALSFMKH